MSLENVAMANDDVRNPIIKLIDFGLCRYFPNHATNDYNWTVRMGKETYMSPEVAACRGRTDRRYDASKADIW